MTEVTNQQQTDEAPHPSVDPSAGFEPTRPGFKWYSIALGLAVTGILIANWPAVAAHVTQIEHALGMK